jgi:DNA-binding NtrC family response regulator
MYFHRTEKTSTEGPSAIAAAMLPDPAVPLEEVERMHIERTLKHYNYSRTKTASALGISKKTLYLKIKQYGMKVQD